MSALYAIMERYLFNRRRDESSDPTVRQRDFNNFVENYNEDFKFFLRRAASGHYKGMISAGRTLKDLHELVIFMQSATALLFEVTPLPFTFRHGAKYYSSLGFDDQQVANIHGFFDYVRETCHKDFEECMKDLPEHLYFK